MEYQFIDLLSINWIEKSYKLCNYKALHDVQHLRDYQLRLVFQCSVV